MAKFFWDWKVVLLVDFMPQGTTINSESYCASSRRFGFFFFSSLSLLIGWQLSIWICCSPFSSSLYISQLFCFWRLALSIVVEVVPLPFSRIRSTIQNWLRGPLSRDVLILHDNAGLFTVTRKQAMLQEFGWEVFEHPAYISDFA